MRKKSLLSRFNPFRKKDPTEKLMDTLTDSISTMFRDQIDETMSSTVNSITGQHSSSKKSQKNDEAEQNRLYAAAIAATNGDRDHVQRIPDPIKIKNFANDKMPPEERQEAQEIIDIINEANEINRTGHYRTEEDLRNNDREYDESPNVVVDILRGLGEFFTPIMKSIATTMGAIVSIVLMSKLTKLVEAI